MRKIVTSMVAAFWLVSWVQAVEFNREEAGMISLFTGRILEQAHYSQAPLDEKKSRVFLEDYLEDLDPNRMVFLQSDIDEFRERYGTQLPDYIFKADASPAFEIFNRYKQRRIERSKMIEELLEQDFDFAKDESFMTDRDGLDWPKSADEARELWRKRIKYDMLIGLLADETQEEVLKRLKKRYHLLLTFMEQMDSEDILQTYLTALTNAYDPHSDYLGPAEAENFEINQIKLSLTGIGALLRWDDGYTKIVSLVPDGPAEKSGELQPDDRIIAVAPEGDDEWTDTIEMPLKKVVEMIRGPIRTKVGLSILPADGSVKKEIHLVRDVIPLKDRHAKARVIDRADKEGMHYLYGVVELPSFYQNCADDVEKLIKRLEKENISGLILDLRQNSGGILSEAVELAGLFIDSGPIVQVKDYRQMKDVLRDPNPKSVYDGPMLVLVNRLSASASEIVAAALQDYERAVIVGDEGTHGKGTVQTVYSLDDVLRSINKPGELKFTISKFYRIDGETTQLRGVTPDIVLPSVYDYLEIGEASLKNSLPADSIAPEKYDSLKEVNGSLDQLRKQSVARVQDSKDFAYIREDIEQLKERQANKAVSLNLEKRLQEKKENEARREARKKERAARPKPDVDVYEITLDTIEKDDPMELVTQEKTDDSKEVASVETTDESKDVEEDGEENGEENPEPLIDPYLGEALNILSDYIKVFPEETKGRMLAGKEAL